MLIVDFSLFSGYFAANSILENYFNKKNARNMIAGLHAFSSVVANSAYLITGNPVLNTLSLNISTGYFLFDGYYIVRFDKLNLLRYFYLYHHFASLFMIKNYMLFNGANLIILVAELSNLPSYVIYHYMHIDDEKKNKKTEEIVVTTKKIQKVMYGLIRVPVMSYILYDIITSVDFNTPGVSWLIGITFPVYLMGIGWTIKLLTQ